MHNLVTALTQTIVCMYFYTNVWLQASSHDILIYISLFLVPPAPTSDVCAVYGVDETLQSIETSWNEVVSRVCKEGHPC